MLNTELFKLLREKNRKVNEHCIRCVVCYHHHFVAINTASQYTLKGKMQPYDNNNCVCVEVI